MSFFSMVYNAGVEDGTRDAKAGKPMLANEEKSPPYQAGYREGYRKIRPGAEPEPTERTPEQVSEHEHELERELELETAN